MDTPRVAPRFDYLALWHEGRGIYESYRGVLKRAEQAAPADPLVRKALDYIQTTLQAMDEDHRSRPQLEPILRLLNDYLANSTREYQHQSQDPSPNLAAAKRYFETAITAAAT